jgi:hypothetical protein
MIGREPARTPDFSTGIPVPSGTPEPREAWRSDALQAGLEPLYDNLLFDKDATALALKAYLDRETSSADSLWGLAKMGQWQNFVKTGESDHRAIRTITEAEPAGR